LKLRGPGELEGTSQSGILDLRIADITADTAIIESARNDAKELLSQDVNLEKAQHQSLNRYFALYQRNANWGRVS
jgi:ATP-dependent DNA helicase RecG